MARTFTGKRLISPQLLTASTATYYTVPTSCRTYISRLTVNVTTATARTVTIYFVPSGGTAAAGNQLWNAKSLAAGESKRCKEAEGQWLEAGETIQALASAASEVSIRCSGIEVKAT